MFCPRCGSSQSDELKFCKVCGANLFAVRQVVDTRDTDGKIDRSKPWFADMAISDAESRRRKEELDHRRGLAPEVTRYNEIKGGIITASAGLAVAIFLALFMQGIILSGNATPEAAEILSRVWLAGIIPVFIGIALIVNGVFVSKKLADIARQAALKESHNLDRSNDFDKETNRLSLNSADTTEFVSSPFSVTEGTTKHLQSADSRK